MTRDLSRLLRPQSVAVVGGGAWCRAVLQQIRRFGPAITLYPVHPNGGEWDGISVYKTINDLPVAPDAAFVGVNRNTTIDTVAALRRIGAGGAVCFASGFAEVADGEALNAALLAAAGDMPILGPNCYGMINALDGALLWPDQHGCVPVARGVAILTQSSNIAINLTMQRRGLPLAYVITCGNQAQTTQADIALGLLEDSRVTAIGLHIEGFGDLAKWQTLARRARDKGVPLVAIKVGRSSEAQQAAVSHTASLAGGDAGAQALLGRLGIARVDDLAVFLETLKILHMTGPLPSANIASISCSGGEASLAADIGGSAGVTFPALNDRQRSGLHAVLGSKVTLANPLDYHTYIWRDTDAMTNAFSAMLDPDLALTMLIVDFPREDRCDAADWACTIAAAKQTRGQGGPVAMVATLPELMPETVALDLMQAGVIPLAGLSEAMHAVGAAVRTAPIDLLQDLLLPAPQGAATTMSESAAKAALSGFGLTVPRAGLATNPHEAQAVCARLNAPFALKGEGFAHKTEAGAVRLNLQSAADVADALQTMQAQSFLIEEMVPDTVAELLVGVTRDPAHGYVLTLGAGGTLAELLSDTVHLLVPATEKSVKHALSKLKVHKLLAGYRGKPAADMTAVIAAISAIQNYVLANAATVSEVEVNPLICTPRAAIAADALIRKADD